jgi:rfaE bifunctional protein kinase chain/domain/rfaE bifunctional protein nucleotidyltransferase chain/domain
MQRNVNPSPETDKVLSLTAAGAAADRLRALGKIVHCHGAFDLMHIGHIRHLAEAKKRGDFLCISVTADEFINKGPGRPVFNHNLRAEALAALGIVDLVTIVHHTTAIPAIDVLRPDFYVKGSEYEEDDDDATGNIRHERERVEQFGGKLIFTDDIVFSSSTLLNQYFDHLDVETRNFLGDFRKRYSIDDVMRHFDKASKLRVLMVGDTIIDEYNYVEPLGKSPKENMIATVAQGQECFAGGVIAAANHVAGLVAQVDVITMLGDINDFKQLVTDSLHSNVKLTTIQRPDTPTTRKTRFIDPGQMRKLFEVYHIVDTPLDAPIQADIDNAITKNINDYDLVIVTDYGHGMLAKSSVQALVRQAPFLAINVQTNSGNSGFNLVTKYPRADLVCIDTPEARLAVGDKFCDLEEILLKLLPERIDCKRLVLTRGKSGCLVTEDGEGVSIPGLSNKVIDTVGAGDAFFAIAAPMAATGANNTLAGFLGNVAGALKVEIVGHRRSIDKVSLIKAATTLLK